MTDVFGAVVTAVAVLLAGLAFALAAPALIGLVRQRDVYGRAHAVAILDGPVFMLALAAIAVAAWSWQALAMVAVIGYARRSTASSALQAILSAAHAAGLQPQRPDDARAKAED